ncbi:glycoside hydrolase family 16 protein [Suillus placidus]|uniref:Glycoside hydrolase family 16 protein n=1 Tax=Suillus placidus TaxID=48579 RepID=A0A9P7CWS9_9AGAM|nr:glycoside hydrolase family 16 protein [Suillus placidus]
MNSPLLRQEYGVSSTSLLPPRAQSRSRSSSTVSEYDTEFAGPSRSPSPSTYEYALRLNPEDWGASALHVGTPEPDDYLHTPDPKRDLKSDKGGHIFTARGIANLGCLFLLVALMIMLFHLSKKKPTPQGGFNLGGTNATGQIPSMPGNRGVIDVDTPKEAYTKASYMNPNDMWDLVFSDEFQVEGRSFYPGDDPYWEAPSLHYWGTNDLEWYDPSQVTTKGGALQITLAKVDPASNHNLTYKNKFCFTGGLIETSVILPGSNNVHGLWPAIWTMGNLGRAGFGASLEGLWPYSYDSCDVGTLPNQTYPGTSKPLGAIQNGDPDHGGVLSFLPGQRLSACTCPGESHPGPVRANGNYVGRSAPEIDIFEATIDGGIGKVSQSSQWAPFNAGYQWLNTSDNLQIYHSDLTVLNPYHGGAYQQTTSGLSLTNQDCYELDKGCYSIYGFEYKPGFDAGYITWISSGEAVWTLQSAGLGPDTETEIGARIISQEPMYIIANLGFSLNFGGIDFENLQFPATMSIDYIRVYQPSNAHNIGYKDAYTNFNLTWTVPENRLNGGC